MLLSLDNVLLVRHFFKFLTDWAGNLLIFASITHLDFNRSWQEELFFFLFANFFYLDIFDDGHEHFFTPLAPSPNIFGLGFTIAIRTRIFGLQPTVNAFPMKVMAAVSHEKRFGIKANWTNLILFVVERLGVPEQIGRVFYSLLVVVLLIDFYFNVRSIFIFFLLFLFCMDLMGSSPHPHNHT